MSIHILANTTLMISREMTTIQALRILVVVCRALEKCKVTLLGREVIKDPDSPLSLFALIFGAAASNLHFDISVLAIKLTCTIYER